MDNSNKLQIELLAYLVRHINGDLSAMDELKTMVKNTKLNQPMDADNLAYRAMVLEFATKAKI